MPSALGNAVSIAVTKPCTWKLREYSNNYDTLQNQWIQVGYDNQEVINSIVSSVDTEEIEQQRKMNASYKEIHSRAAALEGFRAPPA